MRKFCPVEYEFAIKRLVFTLGIINLVLIGPEIQAADLIVPFEHFTAFISGVFLKVPQHG